MSAIAERVAAGAAFLDEREPGWWQSIDLTALDMACECNCVLGQLITDLEAAGPHWGDLLRQFGVRRDSVIPVASSRPTDYELGFNAAVWTSRGGQDLEYAALEAEWKRVITERRSAS